MDALIACVTHTHAKGNTYLVSDTECVSTTGLVRHIAQAMGKQPRLFPMPAAALKMLGTLIGKAPEVSRLISSLVLDSTKIGTELDW